MEDLDDILNECAILRTQTSAPSAAASSLKAASFCEAKNNADKRNTKKSTDLSTHRPAAGQQAQTTIPPAAEQQEISVFRQPEPPATAAADNLLDRIGYDPVHPDTLADMLQLPAAEVYALLTEWELEGRVAAMAGGRYQRIK